MWGLNPFKQAYLIQLIIQYQLQQILGLKGLKSSTDKWVGWILTRATAKSSPMTNILATNSSQLGISETPPIGAKLRKMLPTAALPKAQYPAPATEKNVGMTTA